MRPTMTNQDIASPEERRRRRHEARASATYHEFLKRASAALGSPPDESERVGGGRCSGLEQRLPFDEMNDLASQLPSKLRELLASSEGELDQAHCRARSVRLSSSPRWRARWTSVLSKPRRAYARCFEWSLGTVSPGAIEQVIHLLQRGLRALWLPRN